MEVQLHGFTWERELIENVYGSPYEEVRKSVSYTSKVDLPSCFNKLDGCDISIKTTGSKNSVAMGDCLRVFDSVSVSSPIHLTVITYKQVEDVKQLTSIVEIDLTNSKDILFGDLKREDIQELDDLVKSIPQKRSPTLEEYVRLYNLRDALLKNTKAIHLDIKCNSQQSRLQCSFNRFQSFLAENPNRIVALSNTHEFRNGTISCELISRRRKFKYKSI